MTRPRAVVQAALLLAAGAVLAQATATQEDRQWLAGDSHVHSHWSPGYDRTVEPPTPVQGEDAIYSTPRNARMARRFGLRWMVTTDHGGPNHAKFNLDQAYPELTRARAAVPEVVQFYGMELNMPGMDHHTLIIPSGDDEAAVLFDIEQRFDAREAWPVDPGRDTAAARRAALAHMRELARLPVLFANHPSRSATGIGRYGRDEPWELRENHDQAPEVYRGMEGAPGHQAATLAPDGTTDDGDRAPGSRGAYRAPGAGTLGGFDQMTAVVGGVWDSVLGEGRRFWIVATSDSHVHYTETTRRGSDFWPGEFHKTYVYARPTPADILDGLRHGRIVAVAGDLVTELDVVAAAGGRAAAVGGTLPVEPGHPIEVTIRFRDPETNHAGGADPTVARVDLIVGEIRGAAADADLDENPTTRVVARFDENDWRRDGDVRSIATTLPAPTTDFYLRVRGTNTALPEPVMDVPGENPWDDLWFYSNPIFVEVDS